MSNDNMSRTQVCLNEHNVKKTCLTSVYLNNSESNNRSKSQNKSYTAAITIFSTFNSKTDNVNNKKRRY
jgi:hypothetical protein